MNGRNLRRSAAMGWTIVLMVLCMMPTRGLGIQGDDSRWLRIPHLDKVAHVTLFFGFGLLWRRAIDAPGATAGIVAAGLLLAAGTEYVQTLPIVGRDADLADGAADAAGLLLGLFVARSLRVPRPEPTE